MSYPVKRAHGPVDTHAHFGVGQQRQGVGEELVERQFFDREAGIGELRLADLRDLLPAGPEGDDVVIHDAKDQELIVVHQRVDHAVQRHLFVKQTCLFRSDRHGAELPDGLPSN